MRLSPPELSYLYTSLTSTPPLRADLRPPTSYRPYSLQTNFISSANGSARITWGTGREGGDILVVVKAQIGDSISLSKDVYGGKVIVDIDGDDDGIVVLTETMSSLLCPRQSSNYGIDLRSLAITEKKAWHVFVDCVILWSDVPLPLDALSLAVRVALQTSLLPRITIEDALPEESYEEMASLLDIRKGRVPHGHNEKVYQVDDDWDNAVPLIGEKDWWRIPVIVTANLIEKTIIFDASPSEIQVTTNSYAIASVPLNSMTDKRKIVFCEAMGGSEVYGAGRGIDSSELQRVMKVAIQIGREFVETADAEVKRLQSL